MSIPSMNHLDQTDFANHKLDHALKGMPEAAVTQLLVQSDCPGLCLVQICLGTYNHTTPYIPDMACQTVHGCTIRVNLTQSEQGWPHETGIP